MYYNEFKLFDDFVYVIWLLIYCDLGFVNCVYLSIDCVWIKLGFCVFEDLVDLIEYYCLVY